MNLYFIQLKNILPGNAFIMLTRTSTRHSKTCSWHYKCRRGYEAANWAQASGSSAERTGRRKKAGTWGRAKVSWLNKVFLRDHLKWTVIFNCIMHSRLREEQQRKQFSQEQRLQEAKAREEKELARQNQENKQKEQQTQLEREVRGH